MMNGFIAVIFATSAIVFMFYSSYIRDRLIEEENKRTMLLICLEKSKTTAFTDDISEVSFIEGWNAGLKAAINLTEEVKKC